MDIRALPWPRHVFLTRCALITHQLEARNITHDFGLVRTRHISAGRRVREIRKDDDFAVEGPASDGTSRRLLATRRHIDREDSSRLDDRRRAIKFARPSSNKRRIRERFGLRLAFCGIDRRGARCEPHDRAQREEDRKRRTKRAVCCRHGDFHGVTFIAMLTRVDCVCGQDVQGLRGVRKAPRGLARRHSHDQPCGPGAAPFRRTARLCQELREFRQAAEGRR